MCKFIRKYFSPLGRHISSVSDLSYSIVTLCVISSLKNPGKNGCFKEWGRNIIHLIGQECTNVSVMRRFHSHELLHSPTLRSPAGTALAVKCFAVKLAPNRHAQETLFCSLHYHLCTAIL